MQMFQIFSKIFGCDVQISDDFVKDDAGQKSVRRHFIKFCCDRQKLNSPWVAARLSGQMGKLILCDIKCLMKKEPDGAKKQQYFDTMAWIRKKAIDHPKMVEKYAKIIAKSLKNSSKIKSLEVQFKQIYQDVRIAAILHDIGRLSEIDVANGVVCNKPSAKRRHHADMGYEILKSAYIKPEIALAVKHHRFANTDELLKDEDYQNLAQTEQKRAVLYALIIQDADKLANIDERAQNGVMKSSEYSDFLYQKDYDISDDFFAKAMAGQYTQAPYHHMLDVMVHYITWGYEAHFNVSKKIIEGLMPALFERFEEEAQREYMNDKEPDEQRFKKTILKIEQLKEFAITQKAK